MNVTSWDLVFQPRLFCSPARLYLRTDNGMHVSVMYVFFLTDNGMHVSVMYVFFIRTDITSILKVG